MREIYCAIFGSLPLRSPRSCDEQKSAPNKRNYAHVCRAAGWRSGCSSARAAQVQLRATTVAHRRHTGPESVSGDRQRLRLHQRKLDRCVCLYMRGSVVLIGHARFAYFSIAFTQTTSSRSRSGYAITARLCASGSDPI